MKTKLTVFFSLILTGALAFADAHSEPIAKRQEAMKTIRGNMKALSQMANGAVSFDAGISANGLVAIEAAAASLPDLFPEGAIDDESEAAPAIWEKPDEFAALIAEFVADTTNSGFPADEFELADRLQVISENCKSCHQGFRIKK